MLLAKSPAERPATAADVLRALEGLVAEPTPQAQPPLPSQPSQPPLPIVMTAETPRPPTRARRPLWPAVAVGLAIVGGAAVIGVRLATREKVDAAARARFDAVIAAEGDPPTPAECRSHDGALVERLARAGSWLHDSAPGAPRAARSRRARAPGDDARSGHVGRVLGALVARAARRRADGRRRARRRQARRRALPGAGARAQRRRWRGVARAR